MMRPAVDEPASREVCAVVCLVHYNNISDGEMHSELCVVYGHNVMGEGTARQ
jgi:hypothetical protein